LDTKSKKYKPSWIWSSFVIGMSIIVFIGTMITALVLDRSFDINELYEYTHADIKDTMAFQHKISQLFDVLAKNSYTADSQASILDHEGDNLLYYAFNSESEALLTNTEQYESIWNNGSISLPEGYNYYLSFDGESFSAAKDGITYDVYEDGNFYWVKTQYGRNRSVSYSYYRPDIKNTVILLAVKERIVDNPYAESSLYRLQKNFRITQWILAGVILIFILGAVLLIFAGINHKAKAPIERRIAVFFNRFMLELKGLATLFLVLMPWGIYRLSNGLPGLLERSLFAAATALILVLWTYLIVIDILLNKKGFLANNYTCLLLKSYRTYEKRYPLQKVMGIRTFFILAAELALMILFFYIAGNSYHYRHSTLILLLILAVGAFLIFLYLRWLTGITRDVSRMKDHMEAIQSGNLAAKLTLKAGSDLYEMSELLNGIGEGIDKAVQKMVKSERMKIELITNVSHDLKTPLTSIISYVDLLSKEEGLPEHVMDYIKILQQKSEGLKRLIQDLFDLSKAASGDMHVEKETLDLGKLVEQTLADIQEEIAKSQLVFRTNLPKEPVSITGDGKKLYRVLLNLYCNVLKYSMEGTRVYTDLSADSRKAILTIKNIANYEMNFSEEDILERFVRGDKARTTDGSGLGLAIADSFVKLCGGTLNIKLDGDLFKVLVAMPLAEEDIADNIEHISVKAG
jgi:signal transduction histidine kinase